MKQLYKCEKCGKVSEDYNVIEQCENSHYVMVQPWYSESGLADTLAGMNEYKEGQEEPNIVHVMFTRWAYVDGEWKEQQRCGKYKLISSYEKPLVITNE